MEVQRLGLSTAPLDSLEDPPDKQGRVEEDSRGLANKFTDSAEASRKVIDVSVERRVDSAFEETQPASLISSTGRCGAPGRRSPSVA